MSLTFNLTNMHYQITQIIAASVSYLNWKIFPYIRITSYCSWLYRVSTCNDTGLPMKSESCARL